MRCDGFAQGGITDLWHISMKSGSLCLIINSLVQSLDDRVAQRQRHIANPHTQNLLIGMFYQVFIGFPIDRVEQVGVFQLLVSDVRLQHTFTSFLIDCGDPERDLLQHIQNHSNGVQGC